MQVVRRKEEPGMVIGNEEGPGKDRVEMGEDIIGAGADEGK